jgi:hypothetical protein
MYDEFFEITGFDLEGYFRRFVDFINNQSQLIIDYYSGLLDTLDRDAYGEYESLLEESSFVINLFDLNQQSFNTVDFWELMEFADDIKVKLETIGNFSRFARSSVKKESFSNEVSVEVAMRENETLEELLTRYGSTDRDSDWVDIALTNTLIQEDYNGSGGKVITLTFKNNVRFNVFGVVDNPEGDKIKGKDVDKHIQFEDDDLKVLGFDDTLTQSMGTLLGLKRNDNPEFPQYGIDSSLVVGTSLKSVALPSVIRQIFQIFATDDIVKEIQIVSSDFGQDSLNLKLNITMKSGEEQKRTLSVNGN